MLAALLAWMATYRYIALFPLAVIEGPIITIAAGSLVAAGQLELIPAYIVIITGDVFADSIYYAVGRFGRVRFINRWGHMVGLSPERIEHLDRHFLRHAPKTLVIGKLAFTMEIPTIMAAGIARYSYPRFVFYMVCGALPKTLGLLLVGYFFGFSLVGSRRDLAHIGYIVLAIIAVGLLFIGIRWVIMRKLSRRQPPKTTTSDDSRSQSK